MANSSSKPRVAIYRKLLLPISETFVEAQARALEIWHPVLVGERRDPDGLQLYSIEARTYGRAEAPLSILDRAMFWLKRPIPRIVATLKSLDVQLVHAHFGTDATSVWPSVKAARLPMLVTLHGKDITVHPEWWISGRGGLRRRVYPKRLLQMARDPAVRFIAVSESILQRAIQYGIPRNKISVRYIGIDTEKFKAGGLPTAQRGRQILFVGRMVQKKAPQLMVRVFSRIKSTVPDATLTMIGDGPLLKETRDLARDLGVQVDFRGACSSQEVVAHMHQARVLCLPSVRAANGDAEGFGMVLLEAQACGLPVVTSAHGGAVEGLCHGHTGFSFPERDDNAMQQCLTKILVDDSLCAAMSEEAPKFVRENYDIRNCTKNLEQEYDSMVELFKSAQNGAR